ncbi:MAG TPA: NnrS family protein [Gemmataceae bacterium]|nr:NnrS family protein [Gemmataceae bacterium]
MARSVNWIDAGIKIPDLLRRAPQVRPVLDRYGLRGCGGPEGPAESLEFFARAHEVRLSSLLDELRAEAVQSRPMPLPILEEKPALADELYRRFFKAGIVVTLTLGALWGAYLLLRIAFDSSFTAVGIHEINAHGHAQIFGWVGLFVMGFAYQAFPRFKHGQLSHPRLALLSWWLMLTGVIARSVLEPLAGPGSWLAHFAVAAAAIEAIAATLFAGIILATWRNSGKPLAVYDYYIVSALAWFILQAVYETVYLSATLATADRKELVNLVAMWQGALRDIQIHGFALLMILGVSQRLFPNFYGLRTPRRRVSLLALLGVNAAVVGEAVSLIFMRNSVGLWAGVWYASVLVLVGSVIALLVDWRIFGASTNADRSLKFLRAAYVWLLVSLGMLVLLPLYQHGVLTRLAPESLAARIGFSHAYAGAARHAITVGFVSLMIVGVAGKIVPTLNGVDVHRLSGLWLPFVLLNTGCALRVFTQVCTDFTANAYPVSGVSGVLEVTGLTLWGVQMWSIMSGRARLRPETTESDCGCHEHGPETAIAANV